MLEAVQRTEGNVGEHRAIDEVIFVGKITHSPDKSSGHRFRPSLRSHLDLPFGTVPVLHRELWIRSIKVLFQKLERSGRRCILLTARSVQKVTTRYIRRLPPQDWHRAAP